MKHQKYVKLTLINMISHSAIGQFPHLYITLRFPFCIFGELMKRQLCWRSAWTQIPQFQHQIHAASCPVSTPNTDFLHYLGASHSEMV